MVTGVIQIKNDIGSLNNLKQDNSKFKVVKSIFEKSLAIRAAIMVFSSGSNEQVL